MRTSVSRSLILQFLVVLVLCPRLARGGAIAIVNLNRSSPVDFQREVLPILRNSCLACHNRTKAKAGLVLETPADILKGGDTGPAVITGKSSQSLLLKAASHDPSVDSPMPPPDNKVNAPQLTGEQLGLIKLWIEQGARGEVGGAAPVVWKPIPASLKPIYAVAVSGDGRFAACGRGNEICIYALPSGHLADRLTDPSLPSPGAAHRDLVESLAFSPDGTILASGGYREIKFWRKSPVRKKLDFAAGPVAASLDGKLLAVGGVEGTIELFDSNTGIQRESIPLNGRAIRAICISDDRAKLAAVCGAATIRVWDLPSRKTIASAEAASNLNAIAWVSGGQLLAVAGDDGVVGLWDLPISDNQLHLGRALKGHRGITTSLAVNPADDSQLLSGGADGTVRLWNVKTGRELRQMRHGPPVLAVAVRPDGKRFISAGGPTPAILWNAKDGKQIAKLNARSGPPDRIASVAFSPDGALVGTAGTGPLQTWDAETGDPVAVLEASDGPDSLAFCGANRVAAGRFASGGEVWELGGQWTLDRTIGGDSESSPFADRVTALDFSPDGRVLAAGGGQPSRQGEILLLHASNAMLLRRLDDVHSDAVLCLRFSPDGKQLASGSADKFVRITDPESGKVLRSFEGHSSHVLGVAWKRDGHTLASAGADNTIRFWDPQTGADQVTASGFDKEMTGVCFLGSTANLVATSGDSRFRILNTAGQEVRDLSGSTDFLYAAAATPDGALVVAGGQDGIFRIWNTSTGRLVAASP